MDNNKKVIMVEGNGSKWFEKAIFIVGDGKRVPKDVLTEAETIINDYFLKKYNNHMPSRVRNERKENYYDKRGSVKKKIRKRNFGMVDAVMFLSMLLCIVMIVIVVNSVW